MSDGGARRTVRKLTPAILIIAVAVIVGLILVFSSFFVVDQKEEAVVLNLGKFSRMVGPGFTSSFRSGWRRTTTSRPRGSRRKSSGSEPENPGSCRHTPTRSIRRIDHAHGRPEHRQRGVDHPVPDHGRPAWLFNVENQEKTIRDISQSVINMLVGDRTIFDVIGAERANIEVQGQELMNDLYKSYGLGIRVTTVKLQNIVPPKGSVQDAFEDVNKAIQDRSRLINEGKEAYNQAIPKASGRGGPDHPGGAGLRHGARQPGQGRRGPVPGRSR